MTRTANLKSVSWLVLAFAAGCSTSAPDLDAASSGSNPLGGKSGEGDAGFTAIGPATGTSEDGGAAPASVACAVAMGLAVTGASSSSIALSWPSGAASVKLARKSYCGTDDYETLAVPAGATSFTDTTVQASWDYWYELTVTDASGAAATQTIGTQAAAAPVAGCSGGAAPQSSGADTSMCSGGETVGGGAPTADGGPTVTSDAGGGDGGPSGACTPPPATGTDVTKAPYNVKNDGSDTTAALQSAITTLAAQKETAFFPAGTYFISKTVDLPANTSLASNAGAKIQLGSGFSGTFMFSTAGNDVSIDGLTFDGANLALSAIALNPGSGYSLTNDTFQNSLTDTDSYTGEVTFYGLSTGSNISHCSFKNIGPSSYTSTDIKNDYGPVGIYLDVASTVDDTTLDDNLFDVVGEGIHGPSSSATLRVTVNNLEIARNVMTHIHRIPIEIQGAGDNLQILDNYVSDYVNPYWGTFGVSIAAPSTTNVLIRGNVVDGRLPTTVTGFWGISIEAGGFPVTVTGNYVLGYAGQTASVALISAHHTTATSFVHDNFFCGNAGDTAEYENPSTDPGNWRAPSPGDVITPNTTTASCTGAPAAPPAPASPGPCN